MKTLLVALFPDDEMKTTLDVVTAVARSHNSHVIGYMPIPGRTYMTVATPEVLVPVDDTMQRRFKSKIPEVRDAFEKRMNAENLSHEFRSDERPGLDLTLGIVAQGRTSDLIIVKMHTDRNKITGETASEIADLVMAAGRPVLAIPPQLSRPFACDRVTIAWNGSRESARAAFDCLPFLDKLTEADLISINPEKLQASDVKTSAEDIALVLSRHGATVKARPIISHSQTGGTIVEHAISHSSDLLVVGAYGHSRLRERILGGVTEHILRHPPCVILLSN